MPELLEHEVTAVYVGLRAATEHTDYQVSIHADEGYACVGGIRSTGLSGLDGDRRARARAARRRRAIAPASAASAELSMPNIGEAACGPTPIPSASPATGVRAHRLLLRARDARRDPRRVRVAGAARRPRRPARTRSHMGRCQGFFCGGAGGADRGAGRRMSVVVVGGGPAGLAAARGSGGSGCVTWW